MTYEPEQMQPSESELTPHKTYAAAIVHIDDGVVKDFVKNTEKWEGDIENPAINVHYELQHNGNTVRRSQVFNYIIENGNTKYSARGNLAKYKAMYGNLPSIGDRMRVLTNAKGIPKIVVE